MPRLRKSGVRPGEKPSRQIALEYLADIRFHQSFVLAANPANGRPKPIRVTYSDFDYREDIFSEDGVILRKARDGPVLLFIGGMYGGRYMAAGAPDALVEANKSRLVVVDKFGMGGTGRVGLEHRINAWLDMVPALLAHINVQHVALLSHSCGSIYLLNTVLHHRHILHPKYPYIAMLAPWVHPAQSSSWTALNLVPTGLLLSWPSLAKFLARDFNRAVAASSSAFHALTPRCRNPGRADIQDQDEEEQIPIPGGPDLWNAAVRYVCQEDMSVGAQEAMLCLKRGKGTPWGKFEDYDEAVRLLVVQEREWNQLAAEKLAVGSPAANSAAMEVAVGPDSAPDYYKREDDGEEVKTPAKLAVDIYYAESDGLIGKKGAEWVEKCWAAERLDGEVDYQSETVEGTGHENIASIETGVLQQILGEVRDCWGDFKFC